MQKVTKLKPPKPPSKDHVLVLRLARDQYEKIMHASERANVPMSVLCRAIVLKAIDEGRDSPLRGNVSDYVAPTRPPRRSKAAKRATCPIHAGEPLYVTDQGPACQQCERTREPEPSRAVGT